MQRGVDGTWIASPLQQQSSPSPVRILRAAVRCGCRRGLGIWNTSGTASWRACDLLLGRCRLWSRSEQARHLPSSVTVVRLIQRMCASIARALTKSEFPMKCRGGFYRGQTEAALCSTFAHQVTILKDYESPITGAGRLGGRRHS